MDKLPETLISDNVAQLFTSVEFAEFVKRNSMHHIKTLPYHSS